MRDYEPRKAKDLRAGDTIYIDGRWCVLLDVTNSPKSVLLGYRLPTGVYSQRHIAADVPVDVDISGSRETSRLRLDGLLTSVHAGAPQRYAMDTRVTGIQQKPFFMVFNPAGQAPKVQHYTREAAEKEAERLARANAGQTFHVMAVVKTVKQGDLSVIDYERVS